MSAIQQEAAWTTGLEAIEERLNELEGRSDSDSGERREESESKVLARILGDACNIVRRVPSTGEAELADVVEKVGEVLNRGINIAYGSDIDIDFIHSFAHEEGNLVEDPIKYHFGELDAFWSSLSP